MSRNYEMTLEVSGVSPTPGDAMHDLIFEAAQDIWGGFEDFEIMDVGEGRNEPGHQLWSNGQAMLAGGESEEQFTHRLATAIWAATGKYFLVRVRATYLDDLPCETHQADEEEYADWQAEQAQKHDALVEEQRRDEKRGLYPEREDPAN